MTIQIRVTLGSNPSDKESFCAKNLKGIEQNKKPLKLIPKTSLSKCLIETGKK